MIKFFSKIRRQLLVANKLSRYLLYAIGEIILVVIGILVALQINNWKEQQKQKQLQAVYLSRLVNDLDQDLYNINYVQEEITENQEVIANFIDAINTLKNKALLLNNMTAYFEKGWLISEFVPSANTYTDLSQTGNMKVIQNSGLVNDIIAYYGYMEQIKNSNNVNKDWITSIDQAVAKETSAFKVDPNTRELFPAKDRIKVVENLLLQKELLERDAAGHFWINNSLKDNLRAIKGLTEDLKQDIEDELINLGK